MPDPNSLPPTGPTHVCQSECRSAQDCGLAWHGQWNLGVRMASTDGPPQRVGSLGHACLAEHVYQTCQDAEPNLSAAIEREARKRRYIDDETPWDDAPDDLAEQAMLAAYAAHGLIASPDFNVRHPVLDASGRPMVEAKMVAGWGDLYRVAGLVLPPAMLAVFARDNRRRGMEGTLDVLHAQPVGVGRSVLYLDDYKFRTRAVDGAVVESTVPDGQGAFYRILIRALGLDAGFDAVYFRQVNVYAGRWHTLDDFLDPGSEFCNQDGLPTRDPKRLAGMVAPDVWAEAWRILSDRRRIATANRKGGPRLPTYEETDRARAFIDDLSRRRSVHVNTILLDHSVCLEVVRDMLSAVAGRFVEADTWGTPGRNLRSHPSSPCARHYGCAVQAPCLAAVGSNNVEATFREMVADGRYHLRVAANVTSVGRRDGEAA